MILFSSFQKPKHNNKESKHLINIGCKIALFASIVYFKSVNFCTSLDFSQG
ncbi:hypothetical protein PPHE_b0432 [Pseudoalteromonas phenolica O-BC30]|nr:hypothetical protein [Pseudoalteromonas phenolica O-BC30]